MLGSAAMKIGYFGANIGCFGDPDSIERLATTVESLGYESLWTAEHVVLVDPQQPPSPAPPQSVFLDTVASLAFLAAKTTKLVLGSGIILLPQRDPIVLAKELAAVDVLSKGRLQVGVGVGYVEGEYRALGIPFKERGARMSEHIEVLRTLWTYEQPAFDGRFTNFRGIQARPLPVQKPHPPIVVGGMSPAALRRAVLQANGWYGFYLDVANTEKVLDALRTIANACERPAHLSKLEVSITPPGPIDRDEARRYADLGVDRIILMRSITDMTPAADEAGIMAFIAGQAEELGL